MIVHSTQLKARDPSGLFSHLREILSTGRLDWIVFMSPEGVQPVFQVFKTHGNLLPSILGQCRFFAIGPRTREALERQGVRDVEVPRSYSSEGIATSFAAMPNGGRVLLVRSSEADDSLARSLTSKGCDAVTVHAYSTDIPEDRSSVREFVRGLDGREVGGVLFTSARSASNLFEMIDELGREDFAELLRTCVVGAIGPVTARKLRELGVQPEVQPTRYLINEAVKVLVETLRSTPTGPTVNPPSQVT